MIPLRIPWLSSLVLVHVLAIGLRSARAGEPVTGATGQRGEEAGWPCWRGPLGGGVVPDPGRKLVRDLGKAKVVWTSEDQLPFPYENNLGKKQGWFRGFGRPVVEDGRVLWVMCGRMDETDSNGRRMT